MLTSADSTSQQINELAWQGSFPPLLQDELPGLGSVHDGQCIWMLKTAHLLLCVHLHCQPLLCPRHLHARTEGGNPFFPLEKGCNKLLSTFGLDFHTSCSLVSTVILNWDFYTQRPRASFLVSLQADIYTSDNLGPFIPARRMWHFVPNPPQNGQAEHTALLSLLLTHKLNSRFGPAGKKIKIIL